MNMDLDDLYTIIGAPDFETAKNIDELQKFLSEMWGVAGVNVKVS